MSLTKNQKLSFWKEVEFQIRSVPLRMDNHLLSKEDVVRVANAYVLWCLVIQDLLGDARIHTDKNMYNWVKFLITQDVQTVVNNSKLLLTCIRNWSPYMGDQSLESFKHFLVVSDIVFSDHFYDPFRSILYEFVRTNLFFNKINSVLSFIGRLTLNDVRWIEEEAIIKYVTFENNLKLQDYPEDIITELRSIYQQKVKHFPLDKFRPKHGNGATSQTKKGTGIDEKFNLFRDTFGTHQLSLMSGWSHPLIKEAYLSGNDVHANVSFVPKGINKKRVISTEPICNQYYQHYVAAIFDSIFESDKTWCIDLHDQSHNQKLALRGSGHGTFATIDLSDASDSVSHALVTGIMSHTPLYSLMERCRTRHGILPDGTIIPFEKYAPMGSAICFPLECMVFSLVVQLASKQCGVNAVFRIYGDDIVVPDSIFDKVVYLLEKLHFSINVDKTFPPFSVFTESCGIECYNKVDVSPIRIPRFYDIISSHDTRTSPGRVFGIITFANRLWSYDCFKTRAYLIADVLDILPDVPFTSNAEKGLFSPQATNFHLKTRWNTALQRQEYLCTCISTVGDDILDDRRLIHLLEKYDTCTRTSLLDPSDLVKIMVGTPHLRLKRRWRSQWDIDSISFDL